MKAVILAAGYGTRLNRDLQNDRSGHFKHLCGIPKPLLPVGNKALISHWMSAIEKIDCIDEVYVITNDLYYVKFEEWAKKFQRVKVLSDGTRSNEERLGAVACLQLAITQFNINDHVLVLGGDTLFYEDFSLSVVLARFTELQSINCDNSLVLSYFCKDEAETTKFGILETDEEFRVTAFKEKPSSTETTSRRACPCFYVYSKSTIPLIAKFLQEKQNSPLEEKDAPGHYLHWVYSRKPVFVHHVSGRFDVGNLPSYIDCTKYFQKHGDE
ncbi:glucose-1-phosphate adenylyltransferase isoform X1 [Hemiscyllium ocellatum]|uniref:glucose-1-phosphate adenylyltransferase isoform X1 n=1 Tax=Hemiscyllium ocellatum TaxID=170820 RepID=UPI0029663052|nr:glucose-1-phosphate adenylyltransferase isoform X1 [Hemiscyllium ocellatum]XP_060683971.1 glucose-1-phosphate adenylyltransferase isoform X1 [Hemiscyllium ocellatum]XP_060683972.1 glucose-1-phosphate adenylyltransferase isoform X1 [Hemiscyllium ocellatum]XP_060683973.1 glucose-1-phosphate adenylyltransferase isoform X1 [Hemiscyllium ocellatum]